MTTTTDRATFRLYKIERDNFDGRLQARLTLAEPDFGIVHLRDSRGRCYADDINAGPAGTITAPAGSRVVDLVDDVEPGLELPDGEILSADEAYQAARSRNRAHSYGLGWSPHQAAEVE